MARRTYLTQDKHLEAKLRPLVQKYKLRAEHNGAGHIKLIDQAGKIIGTVPTTGGRRNGTAEKTISRIRRLLEAKE